MNTLCFLLTTLCLVVNGKYVMTFHKYKDMNCTELDYKEKYDENVCYDDINSTEINLQSSQTFQVDYCLDDEVTIKIYNNNDCDGTPVWPYTEPNENQCYSGEKFTCEYENKGAQALATFIVVLIAIGICCCLVCVIAALKYIVCK